MIKLLLVGCNGKMGQVICRMAQEDPNVEIVCGVDLSGEAKNGFPVVASTADVTVSCDCIIDFSHPDALRGTLDYAVRTKTPAVVATTGLDEAQKQALTEAAQQVPIFFSANMSLGVNLIISLAQKAAQLLEEKFDIEIIEKHHNQKVDAPSGTALAIADAICEACAENKEYIYDRHSSRRKRKPSEIGIHAVRGGTIVGEHTVLFAGQDELIEIKHTATSKEIFAAGAIRAAKFLAGKPSGLYNMQDLVAE